METATHFLSFGCKRTENLDIGTPISNYVLRIYGKERVEDISQDIEEVTKRRSEVVNVSEGGPNSRAKEICASYYRALSAMENRLPISQDEKHAQIPFSWANAMNPKKKCKKMNVYFEQAAVLFNIAAHLSQSAAQQNKESISGFRTAMREFQEAASAFHQVRDVALNIENPKPSDLLDDFLMMAEKLMMAQGQECVFWTALKDQKSPLLLARIAKQASILYAETLEYLSNPFIGEDLDKSWQSSVQNKSRLFEVLCQQHAAEDARSKEDIATEISRLKRATLLLQELTKNEKSATQSLVGIVEKFASSVTSQLQKAEDENASVHLMKVPPFNELPKITGAALVKISPCTYLGTSSLHIFSDLVPESIADALSRYSKLVDGLIRKQTTKLEGAIDAARVRMKQYKLPEFMDSITSAGPDMIPEELKKDLQEIGKCGGLTYVQNMLVQLGELKSSLLADLDKAEKDIDAEVAQHSSFKAEHDPQGTAEASARQTADLRDIISSQRENIKNADDSDRVIQEKLTQITENLSQLSIADCEKNFPKLEDETIRTLDRERQTITTHIQDFEAHLAAMTDKSVALKESLEDMKSKDDLLPKLEATDAGFHEELFEKELLKYNERTKDADKDLEKLEELLECIRKAFGNLTSTFDVTAWKQKIDQHFKKVKTDITTFCEIRTSLEERVRLYMEFKTGINELNNRTKDFIQSRKLERENDLETLKANEKPMKMAASQTSPQLPAAHPPVRRQQARSFLGLTALHFAVLITGVVLFFFLKRLTEGRYFIQD